jgi:hypothetical protein
MAKAKPEIFSRVKLNSVLLDCFKQETTKAKVDNVSTKSTDFYDKYGILIQILFLPVISYILSLIYSTVRCHWVFQRSTM